ncbi:MAG: hypothetical protein IKH65_01290, partial [Clostridia bacterium]|nr:hypothetical protein [Clostridia bacterium]
ALVVCPGNIRTITRHNIADHSISPRRLTSRSCIWHSKRVNSIHKDLKDQNSEGEAISFTGKLCSRERKILSLKFWRHDGEEDDYYEEDYDGKKSSKGATAGKVISIIMLVATVVVFVLGCFVSVFLDNGSDIGGMTFSTYAQDPQAGVITKGSLVIAKKIAPDEYAAQDTVIVPSSTGEGCDIMGVISTAPESEESCLLTMTNSSNPNGMTGTYRSADTLGKALYFLPAAGGLLNFATHNAILVCILFILLAALWCLIFILIEKSQSGKNADDGDEDEDDDDDSDSSEEKTEESEEDDSDEPVYKF